MQEEEIAVAVEHELNLAANTDLRTGRNVSHAELVEMVELLKALEESDKYQGLTKFFPDEGPYCYKNYERHLEFMKLGAIHRERIFMAGNRVGKSITGGYEMACHLTGIYPHWWEGKRFYEPTDCWAAGDTSQTTRDIVQAVLLGPPGEHGTGMIPKELIESVRMRPGVPDGVDSIRVKHTSGGTSVLGFKSYDQKRRSFQGTAKHAIWLDEEPPHEVYGECLMRTMTTGGVVYVTFTPLSGWTQFVTEFQKQVHLQEAGENKEGSGNGHST